MIAEGYGDQMEATATSRSVSRADLFGEEKKKESPVDNGMVFLLHHQLKLNYPSEYLVIASFQDLKVQKHVKYFLTETYRDVALIARLNSNEDFVEDIWELLETPVVNCQIDLPYLENLVSKTEADEETKKKAYHFVMNRVLDVVGNLKKIESLFPESLSAQIPMEEVLNKMMPKSHLHTHKFGIPNIKLLNAIAKMKIPEGEIIFAIFDLTGRFQSC